jgi:hypothetical protein
MSRTDHSLGSNRWEVGASMYLSSIISASHEERRIEKASRVTYADLERQFHHVEINVVELSLRIVRPGSTDDDEG